MKRSPNYDFSRLYARREAQECPACARDMKGYTTPNKLEQETFESTGICASCQLIIWERNEKRMIAYIAQANQKHEDRKQQITGDVESLYEQK